MTPPLIKILEKRNFAVIQTQMAENYKPSKKQIEDKASPAGKGKHHTIANNKNVAMGCRNLSQNEKQTG